MDKIEVPTVNNCFWPLTHVFKSTGGVYSNNTVGSAVNESGDGTKTGNCVIFNSYNSKYHFIQFARLQMQISLITEK